VVDQQIMHIRHNLADVSRWSLTNIRRRRHLQWMAKGTIKCRHRILEEAMMEQDIKERRNVEEENVLWSTNLKPFYCLFMYSICIHSIYPFPFIKLLLEYCRLSTFWFFDHISRRKWPIQEGDMPFESPKSPLKSGQF